MTARFLLDTNVVSEVSQPEPSPSVLAALQRHGDACATASVVVHELLYGLERLPAGRRRDELERLVAGVLRRLDVLAYDERAARWHARERARLGAAGTPRPYADGQIAAVAVVNDLVLVTRNTSDVAGFAGLRVASWWD